MANQTLFYSSIFFGIINLLLFLDCEYLEIISTKNDNKKCSLELRILEILSIIIITTSLLNHGYTNEIYKWLDRFIVYIGIAISIHIIIKYKLIIPFILICFSILCYFLSKYNNNNLYHIIIHFLITINNFIYFITLT